MRHDDHKTGQPFVEVRKTTNGYSVIEYVPSEVSDSERNATVLKMLEEAHSAIGDTLESHRRTRISDGALQQRQEYQAAGLSRCRHCKKKWSEHDPYCPQCDRVVPEGVCRAHSPVIVGLAAYCRPTGGK